MWQLKIGLEIHARVLSKTKLFSKASTAFSLNAPNSRVQNFDASLPGALPLMNEYCVDQAIRTGIALKGLVNQNSFFERKHYFYFDSPQGYQITQQRSPIVIGGNLEYGENKSLEITRIQLEQDTGKTIHINEGYNNKPSSLVDLNRAGIALMEIVTEPLLYSAKDATKFVKTLQSLLRHIKTCDGNMEEGSLRVDVNVSVHNENYDSHRVEIKNLNSFRSIENAIAYEEKRLIKDYEENKIVNNTNNTNSETRTYDVVNNKTILLRSKEDKVDYRFVPEPDLLPLIVTNEKLKKLTETMPELPIETMNKLIKDYNLSEYNATILFNEVNGIEFFELVLKYLPNSNNDYLATFICNDLLGKMHLYGIELLDQDPNIQVTPKNVADILELMLNKKITHKISHEILELILPPNNDNRSIKEIVEANSWETLELNETDIETEIQEIVFAENEQLIQRYKDGEKKLFGPIMGKVMQHFKNRADPKEIKKAIKNLLL